MTDAATLLPDPSPRLEAAFRTVMARMAGLGIVNPALVVEAVGFAPWNAHWLGVLVTPWFMNLILAPRDLARWEPLATGANRQYVFPAGAYEFIGVNDVIAGEYQFCSLFSPVREFEDQTTVRLVAQLAREALFDPDNAEVPAMPIANLSPAAGALAKLEVQLDTQLSKRDFIRGRFLPGGHDDRG